MEEDWDLDGYIISSLLSSAGSDLSQNQLNLEQLEITLTLNRADIAKEKIFLENKKWKKGDLNDYMFNALMSDRHDFVKLLLEQGFSLEEFLTVYTLEKLYTEQLKNMNSRIAIFHKMWDNHKTHRVVPNVKLREVGKVIKTLVGDFYHPLYLSKEFQNLILKTAETESKAIQSTQITNQQPFHENSAREDIVDKLHTDQTVSTRKTARSKNHESLSGRNKNAARIPKDDIIDEKNKQQNRLKRRRSSSLDMINKLSQVHLYENSQNSKNNANDGKMQEKNNKHINNDGKLKEISLERPARELMIWSLLVGKLQMAELFWTMEKEQIAGALLASMLLTSLASKTDDFTDKEDYKTYSKHFESQAEGVLNECYVEDEKRAQLLINKQLKYYGQSSVILLAAQGESIKFMAHPCCQDFLTSIWYGDLSSKNSALQILSSVGLGLIIPFLIPKVILYKEDEAMQSMQTKVQDPLQIEILNDNTKDDVEIGIRSLIGKSKWMLRSKPQRLKRFKYYNRIKGFYFSPIVRFVYNAVSYLTFLLLFSVFLLFKFKVEFVPEEIILSFWIGTLLLEEIKQIFSATFSGISFSTYFSDGWNKLDSTAITLFVIGFILRLITYFNNQDALHDLNLQYHIILTDPIFIGSQTCMGCSLFFFYVRVMYIFGFHIALGPKLIMIRKMISNDLVPFMIILSVFMIGYGVTAYANAYPLGLQFTDDMLQNTTTPIPTSTTESMIMTILLKSYYPMFGEFGLDSIQGISQTCSAQDTNLVPTKISRTLIPLFMGLHVLLTNVLLFNLLIAMFTKTYEEIESSSLYYWNYQRYQMISEFVNKSPLVPPFIIIWHIYEISCLLKRKFIANQDDKSFNSHGGPFCINFSEELKKERELVKWEHMKAMDYLRKLNEPTQKSRQTRGADGRSLVFRGFGSGGAAANALVPQVTENKPDLSGLTEELNHQLDKRFKDVDIKLYKLNELEVQLAGLTDTVKDLNEFLVEIRKTQEKLVDKIENIPKCQCMEVIKSPISPNNESTEDITKLEMAVRSAIWAMRSEFQPLMTDHTPLSKVDPVHSEIDESEQSFTFVTNDDTGDSKKDPFFAPQVEDLATGRLIERVVNNHRIWRYLPFNFELYPGMRMKVPNNMVSWKIPYSDYNAFDAGEEVLLYPNEHCYDTDDPTKYKTWYNNYDQANKIKRQSMLGQYAIDSGTDAPLNPTGRTGLKGRGLLPHWGPNHSIIILFTRWQRSANGSPIHKKSKRMMQYIALERANRFGIPWFLVDHTHGCDLNECSNKTTMAFINQRLEALFSSRKLEFIQKKILSSTCSQTFKGFLDDHLNADNAWVETVVINFHEADKFLFTDDLLKIFAENNSPETVKWLDVTHSVNLRTSHDIVLKILSQKMNAFF